MVPRDDECFREVVGAPVEERECGHLLAAKVDGVSGDDEEISGRDDRVILEKAAVLFELEMKVGTKLDGHASWIMR